MNTAAIKKYAPKARLDFIQAVTQQAAIYGISDQGIAPSDIKGDYLLIGDKTLPASVAQQRNQLIAQVQQNGFKQTMEAIAYGWFNRFIAIRYMELHDYLEHGRRVLSHPTQSNTFQILEECADIDLPNLDKANIIELKLDGTQDERLYRELLLAQCHALHAAMPFLFEALNSATELLLPDNLTQTDSIIHDLVTAIPEADWQNVEIVGWLYQFYIAEKKDQVIGKVVKSEDIPAATQLFTPNWIVKYMVQNSVGAQWLATYPDSPLKAKMEYYIEPAEQTDEVQQQLAATTPDSLDPETITIMDPACGSGHILVEAYSLMREIYLERGYRERDIPLKILQNNLFGLDIDDRAAQLSGFALMMKAREDDRRIFSRLASQNITINVLALQDSKQLDLDTICDYLPLGDYGLNREIMHELIQIFEQAKTFGSLILIPQLLQDNLESLQGLAQHIPTQVFEEQLLKRLKPLIHQTSLLSKKYHNVIANPPYMGGKGMNPLLKTWATKNYKASKSDLFAMFIERGLEMVPSFGYNAMVTMQSWMFLSSYESLRAKLMQQTSIEGMAHMANMVMGIAFGTAATIWKRDGNVKSKGAFCYIEYEDIDKGNKPKKFPPENERNRGAIKNPDCGWFYRAAAADFKKIPGSPIAYWLSREWIQCFDSGLLLKDISPAKLGMRTGDNNKWLRKWFEVDVCTMEYSSENSKKASLSLGKWFPYNKGGDYRRWYGNNEHVVFWENDGYAIKAETLEKYPSLDWSNLGWKITNEQDFFKKSVTWSFISSSNFGVRISLGGAIFDVGGSSIFPNESELNKIAGFLCSRVAFSFLKAMNSTLNFQVVNINSLPWFISKISEEKINNIVSKLLLITKKDWDSYETSWDFVSFPLFQSKYNHQTLESVYQTLCTNRQATILETQDLEEENNSIFIEAYGLHGELSPEISLKEITLTCNPHYRYGGNKTEQELEALLLVDTMKELISYSIGCMMGRYSLDKEGLIYAHSGNIDFDSNQYTTFPADDDGIIPLTDREWFDDDATNRFKEFISVTWDKDHLHENLSFVADNLKPKRGEDALDTIRRYMSTGFFKDHLKTYKKRPIYWLFSSGKEKAFEALVYLHRYNEGTLARMRTEYVIPLSAKLNAYEEQLKKDQEASSSAAETKRLEKDLSSIHKKQTELANFDEKLRHYADQRISLDLDDGVKVNYGKFGDLLSKVRDIHGKVVG